MLGKLAEKGGGGVDRETKKVSKRWRSTPVPRDGREQVGGS